MASGALTDPSAYFQALAASSPGLPDWAGGAACITPDGHLHLAVCKEVHERLGLTGASSRASPGGVRGRALCVDCLPSSICAKRCMSVRV